jgi:hypothetical protein
MVVWVAVGFLYMSISIAEGCRVIRRSMKLILLFSSIVGVNSRFGCKLFR